MTKARISFRRFCVVFSLIMLLPAAAWAQNAPVTTVTNYNTGLARITGNKGIYILRCNEAGKTTLTMSNIRDRVRELASFYKSASDGVTTLTLLGAKEITVTGNCSSIESEAAAATPQLGQLITVVQQPATACSVSHAGGGHAWLTGGLFRDTAHECGHLMGLAHTNGFDGTNVIPYHDGSSFMGSYPSRCYSEAQLHWLGWTKPYETVRVNDLLASGPILVNIRPIDTHAPSTSTVPIAYEYDIPGANYRIWISVPASREEPGDKLQGGDIRIHYAPNGKGTHAGGMIMGSLLYDVWGATDGMTHRVPYIDEDLEITPVAFQATQVKYNGAYILDFSQITLKIELK